MALWEQGRGSAPSSRCGCREVRVPAKEEGWSQGEVDPENRGPQVQLEAGLLGLPYL